MSIPKSFSAAVLVLGVLATPPSFAGAVPVQPTNPPPTIVLCTMTKLNPPQVGKANVTVTTTKDLNYETFSSVVMGAAHGGTVMHSGCGSLSQASPLKFVYTAKPLAAIPTWTCHVEYTLYACPH